MAGGVLIDRHDRSALSARDRAFAEVRLLPADLRRLDGCGAALSVGVSGTLGREHQLAIARTAPVSVED